MRPNVASWLTLAGVFLVAACSNDQTLAPPSAVQFSGASVPVCDVAQVTALINGLYPPGAQGAAHANFAIVRSQMNSGNETAGRGAMFTLLKGTLLAFDRGQLRVSKKLGLTLDEGINQLGQQLYACAGLGASAPPNLGTILSDGGTAQVVEPSSDPNPQVVETDDGRAAASFPAGSVDQTLLVTIEPDPNGTNPFPETRLQQFQPFFDFSTFPHVDRFGAKVTVGICVSGDFAPGQFARLQLAHPDPATNHTTLEILHRVAPPPGVCGPAGTPGPIGMRQGSSLPMLAQRMVNWVLPTELQAALLVFGGVGGQTESFTDFRAVDPASHLSFTVQPSNTNAGATITPAVQVAVKSSDGQTISSFHGDVTLALTGNSDATLSGTTTVTAVNGVASFPNLAIDLGGTYRLDATAVGTMDPVTGVADPAPTSDTSFTFVITGGDINLEGIELSSTTAYIDGGSVPYDVIVSNTTGSPVSVVVIQAWIDQGSTTRAAGGAQVLCTQSPGTVPPGPCRFTWNGLVASNEAAGTGTLVPGDASARFELRQGSTVLDSFTIPITLAQVVIGAPRTRS